MVKNNLLFFNIFIDMLNIKIQVLINTLVQDKLIPNNSKRMIQVAETHWSVNNITLEKHASFNSKTDWTIHQVWVWDQVIQGTRVFPTRENEGSFPNTVNIQTWGKRYIPCTVYFCGSQSAHFLSVQWYLVKAIHMNSKKGPLAYICVCWFFTNPVSPPFFG